MNQYLVKPIMMKQIYPMMISDSIMSDLSGFDVPWNLLQIEDALNLGYYQHSAQKLISPMLYDMTSNMDSVEIIPLTEIQRLQVAGLIFNIFNRKWTRLWNAFTIQYNPISNYDMTENETIEDENANIKTDTGNITNVIDTDTTQTGTVSNSGTNSQNNSVYGFNSSSSVNSDSTAGTDSNTRIDNLAGTTDTTDTETHNLTINDSGTRNSERTLTRSGNIGVTTSQQMLNSEIELWQWNFFKMVFDDIDSILCLDIY